MARIGQKIDDFDPISKVIKALSIIMTCINARTGYHIKISKSVILMMYLHHMKV